MSTCNVDVRWFPFDIQKCELKFGSWTYDGWLLDLQMSTADVSSYMPNGEWDLIGEQSEALKKKKKHGRQKGTKKDFTSSWQESPEPGASPSTTAARSRTRP